jgi:hypothetical protein
MERAASLEGENLVATELEHLSSFGRKPEFSTVTQMAEARLAEFNDWSWVSNQSFASSPLEAK